MGENSKIGWTHHTFNPWWGCHKVSPACKNCYAEAFSKRTGNAIWGTEAPRRFFGEKHWAEPLKWNRAAEKAGERRRVFCGSMMDVLEIHQGEATLGRQDTARFHLRELIKATPSLDWLLLTKRPENFMGCFGDWHQGCPPNVWMGTTVENQEYADLRIPHLLKVKATVLFLSCEPLLGEINLHRWLCQHANDAHPEQKMGHWCTPDPKLSWVISGGESGHHHREHQLEWSRSLRDQCEAAGVAFFFKQLGEDASQMQPVGRMHLVLKPRSKGELLDEIPTDLRIREFPPSHP